jgi:hypothetical protein
MTPPIAHTHIPIPPFIRTSGRNLGRFRYGRAMDRHGFIGKISDGGYNKIHLLLL